MCGMPYSVLVIRTSYRWPLPLACGPEACGAVVATAGTARVLRQAAAARRARRRRMIRTSTRVGEILWHTERTSSPSGDDESGAHVQANVPASDPPERNCQPAGRPWRSPERPAVGRVLVPQLARHQG